MWVNYLLLLNLKYISWLGLKKGTFNECRLCARHYENILHMFHHPHEVVIIIPFYNVELRLRKGKSFSQSYTTIKCLGPVIIIIF